MKLFNSRRHNHCPVLEEIFFFPIFAKTASLQKMPYLNSLIKVNRMIDRCIATLFHEYWCERSMGNLACPEEFNAFFIKEQLDRINDLFLDFHVPSSIRKINIKSILRCSIGIENDFIFYLI